MPIARSSVLWAHVLTSLAANLTSVVIVVLVALLMGFRSGAAVQLWLAVAGILILFPLALTWIAVIVGLTAKTVDGASAFAYPLIFLPFIRLGVRAHRDRAARRILLLRHHMYDLLPIVAGSGQRGDTTLNGSNDMSLRQRSAPRRLMGVSAAAAAIALVVAGCSDSSSSNGPTGTAGSEAPSNGPSWNRCLVN